MSTLDKDTATNMVLHFLAESGDPKSAREISEELGINMIHVNRGLQGARKQKPRMIDTVESQAGSGSSGSKYLFSGDPKMLSPLPQSLAVSAKPQNTQQRKAPEQATGSVRSMGMSDLQRQLIELIPSDRKVPLSSIVENSDEEESAIEQALSEMVDQSYLEKEHLSHFNEDAFRLTELGEKTAQSGVRSAAHSAGKATVSAKKPSSASAPPFSGEGGQEQFTVPDFNVIPEDAPKGPGRPQGDRNFTLLRTYVLAYIAGSEPCTHSNVSRILSKFLKTFGRTSIESEIYKLIDEGKISVHQYGKRDLYSLTQQGIDFVKSHATNADQFIGANATDPKKAEKAAKKAPSRPAAQPPQARQPESTAPEASPIEDTDEGGGYAPVGSQSKPSATSSEKVAAEPSVEPRKKSIDTPVLSGDYEQRLDEVLSQVFGSEITPQRKAIEGIVRSLNQNNQALEAELKAVKEKHNQLYSVSQNLLKGLS